MRQFFFDTGVKFKNHDGLCNQANTNGLFRNQVWREGTKQIPFSCEDVPDGSTFMLTCDNPDLPQSKLDFVIVREIHNSGLLSKYAYFRIPLV